MGRHKKKPKKMESSTKIERVISQLLTEMSLSFKSNAQIDKYTVDFLVNNKLIIECYGDFWHANPAYYAPTYFNKALKCHAQDKWSKDANRQHFLESQGYQFIIFWETDIKKSPKSIRHMVKTLINQLKLRD